jgi:hypothetical protein
MMTISVGAVEYFFLGVLAASLWVFAVISKPAAIGLGYLACLLFLPAYSRLTWASSYLSIRHFIYESLFGGFCIFIIQLTLAEEKQNEMSVLFLASYIACKPLRLSLALAIGRIK